MINAYKTATEETLKQAVIIEKTVNDIYTVQFNYLQMNEVMKIIKDDNLTIVTQSFDNDCSVQLSVRKTMVNQALAKFNKLSGITVKYDHSL